MGHGTRKWPTGPKVRAAAVTALAAGPLLLVTASGRADPLPPPLGACSGPECPANYPSPPHNGDFAGRDASVNVFVGGDYLVTGWAAEVEGKVVALGGLTVDKTAGGSFNMGVVGVGSRVVPPIGSDFVTVGKGIKVGVGTTVLVGGSDSRTAVWGNVKYGTTATGTVSIDPLGQLTRDPAAVTPFRPLLPVIQDFSACMARQAATGTVTVGATEALFAGDGRSARQVFDVPGNLESPSGGAIGLTFAGIPAGATVVVNMRSATPVVNTYTGTGIPGFAGDTTTALRPRLMWNFPTATSATLTGGAQFQGSVMAGNAAGTTTISTAGLNGRVYLAGSLVQTGSGGYEIHDYPFDGDLPVCSSPSPDPSPSASPSPSESGWESPDPSPSPSDSVSPSPSASDSPSPSPSASVTDRPSPGADSPHPAPESSRRPLPNTGSSERVLLAAGVAALLLGAGVLVIGLAWRSGRHR